MEDSPEPPQPPRRTRNAKRSSLACVGCKQVKRRCDISQQPSDSQSCTNCREKKQRCEVRYGEDRRRKRPVQGGADLEARLALLENLLAQRGSEPARERSRSRNTSSPDAAQESIDVHVGSPAASRTPVTERATSPAQVQGQQLDASEAQQAFTGIPSQQERNFTAAGVPLRSPDGNNPSTPPVAVSTVPSSAIGLEDSQLIIGKVVSREGALEGQSPNNVRYFGPTSIYRLSNTLEARTLHSGSAQTAVVCPSSPWADIPPNLDPSNEPEVLVLQLLDLFCTWQASHLQIFHRELFLDGKKSFDGDSPRGRYEFFSPSLLYAIMALASMVSMDRGTRYHSTLPNSSLGSVYFNKAKDLFGREMGDPSMTTVQTALLLGSYFGAAGYQSQGWTYSGIALRMAVELGLHISCDAAVNLGKLFPDVARLRKAVFWGCYVQDKLWSAYCGRPSFIMDWDITVSRPERPRGLDDPAPGGDAIQAAVHWNIVYLTVQCSNILTELYSQKHKGNERQLATAAAAIHADLLKWLDDLPGALRWPNKSNLPSSPHVLLMHMQFHFTLLLLHRPFIDFSHGVPPTHTRLESANGATPCPATICTLAATNITKLCRDYSLSYNLRQIPSPAVHFIFVAATIHLINHQVAGDDSHELLFKGCLSSLAEIGQSYPTGQTAVSVLRGLLRQLQLSCRRQGDSHSQSFGYRAPFATARSTRSSNEYNTQALSADIPPPTHGSTRSEAGTNPRSRGDADAEHADDLMNWAPDFNFDWSTFDSPIAFPHELEDINIRACFEGTEPIRGHSSGVYGSPLPSQFTGIPGGSGSPALAPNGASVVESVIDQSALFLSQNYGTAFGLG